MSGLYEMTLTCNINGEYYDSINTNLSALTAQNNLREQSKEMDQAMGRLSSGLGINSAADDAAGSAIASKMEAQVRSLALLLEMQMMLYH